MFSSWRDALMRLHVRGWDSDDVDKAAEALVEACAEGRYSGTNLLDLPVDAVRGMLEGDLPTDEIEALLVIADLRSQQNQDATALQQALYDLDAFAYAYAGDD